MENEPAYVQKLLAEAFGTAMLVFASPPPLLRSYGAWHPVPRSGLQ